MNIFKTHVVWKAHPFLPNVVEWEDFIIRYLIECDMWELSHKSNRLKLEYEALTEAQKAAERYQKRSGLNECFCDDCCRNIHGYK